MSFLAALWPDLPVTACLWILRLGRRSATFMSSRLRLMLTERRWLRRVAISVGSMSGALVLTHLFWRVLEHTPFLLGFGAAILSSRVGGRAAGFLAVIVGIVGYAWFPPPLAIENLGRLLLGFTIISGAFGWLVARRYEIEGALRSSQERLCAVMANLPVVLCVIDRDGRVILVEGRGLDGLNPKGGGLVGRSVFEVFRDFPEAITNARRVLRGDTFTAVMALGERVVETWYSPLRDDRGSVTGAIGVSLDATTRRRFEEQSLHANKMEAIGQLAGGVAHDFNNLLVAIGGYTDLVLASFSADDARRSDLLEVRKAAERAAVLTRQLLAFSRRQVLHPRVLDVNLLVGGVENLLRRTIGEDIDLVLDLNPDVEPIRADRTQLEQVLLNLAVNARDAMAAGGQLRFATENVEVDEVFAGRVPPMTAGRYVCLTVSDTGSGMTAEVQARIFEPFFTTKESGKGTGLGLATVFGIVKQSGGFIWVDSKPAHGTVFDIYLPAVREPVEAPTQAAPARPSAGGSETILLAEDDGAVRRLAREVLNKWGYTVLEARDGEEALEVAARHEGAIDLLITDVVMPGLGGRALVAKLAPDHPAMRVLYTSGYADDAMLREGAERELRHLPKPFLPHDLIGIVREVLDAPTPSWS